MSLHYFLLAVYTLITIVFFTILQKNKISLKKPNQALIIICCVAFLLRYALAYFGPSFWYDVGCFKSWSECTIYYGLENLYSADIFLDYPPGYMYVLFFNRIFAEIFSIDLNSLFYTIMMKLPAMLTDIASGILIYYIVTKEYKSENKETWGIFFAAAYMFAPAVVYNSSIWGQIDSFYTFFIVLSIYLAYKNKTVWAALVYAYALFTKPQALLFGPVLLFYILQRKSWKEFFKAIGVGLGTIYIMALPFTKGFNPLWLINLYKNTFNGYKYFTVNAYNVYMPLGLNWLGTDSVNGSGAINIIVIGLTFVLCLWAFFKIKNNGKFFYIGYIFITVFFTFCTMMHERYVYPAFLFSIISCVILNDKRIFYLFLGLQGVNYLNVVAIFKNHYNNYNVPKSLYTPLSFILIAICIYSVYLLVKMALKGDKLNLSRCNLQVLSVVALTVFYGIFAFFNLGNTKAPKTFYQSEFAGEWFMMHFDTPQTIDEIYLYFGLGDGKVYSENHKQISNNFEVLYQNMDDVWISLGNMPSSYVFQWQALDVDDLAKSIRVKANAPGEVLYEIVCKNPTGEIIRGELELSRPNWNENSPYNAVDESHFLPNDTSYYSSMYFDEIYHARTAYEQINGYNIYETTHPPLGKSIIEVGIRIFGMTPFGWRFMGTLFGVLMVPLMYCLAKILLKNHIVSLVTAFVFAFDFMHYTQTRISTVDTYVVFFTMLTFLFMLLYSKLPLEKQFSKQLLYLLVSGIFMGLTVSVKWNGAYAMVGLAVFFFVSLFIKYKNCENKQLGKKYVLYTILFCFLAFVIIPMFVYFICFTKVLNGNSWSEILSHFFTYQKNMFDYHSNLVAEHFFASPWYTWIYIQKPIWYSVTRFINGNASSISAFGNPLVWLAIPFALVVCIAKLFNKNTSNKNDIGFILLGYLGSLLPWVFISRLTFIYHYFPAVIFGCLAIGYVLKILYDKLPQNKKWIIYIYPALVFVLFIVFFPPISGLEVSQNYLDMLEILPTWYFN